jgi:hypothetical protein
MSQQLTDMTNSTADEDVSIDHPGTESIPPAEARPGRRLIRTNARPARTRGARGFRFWRKGVDKNPPPITKRDCGWYADRQYPQHRTAETTP